MANHDAGGGDDLEPEIEIVEPEPARRYAHTLRRGDAAMAEPRDQVSPIAMLSRLSASATFAPVSEPEAEADADLAIPIALASSSSAALSDDWWLTRPMMPAASSEDLERGAPELLELSAPEPMVRVIPDATPPPPTPPAESELPYFAASPTRLPLAIMDSMVEAERTQPPSHARSLAVSFAILVALVTIALWLVYSML